MGKRMLARLGAAVAGGALAFTMAAPALADDTEETEVTTDPASEVTVVEQTVSPSEGPGDCDFETVKLDDMDEAPISDTVTDGDVTISVEGDDTKHYSFEVTAGSAVIHSAHLGIGSDSRSYYFNPAVTSASNLTAVKGPQDQLRDVSHIWFCYDEPPPPSSPPATDPPGTDPPRTDPPGTEPPGDKPELPVTGAQVGGLLLLAGGLLAAGVAMIAVRRRRSINDILEG
jgi:LPXTG-motif cell wall-anchored protein